MGNSNGHEVDFSQEVNLSQFKLLKVVGRGSFGKVRIVERRDTKKLYALKYISKTEIIRLDCVKNICRERVMLENVDHPFVCNLRFAFQDSQYLYMVMDLMMGGDLRYHLHRSKFNEHVVRFWIAELACAVRYLHSKGIVHRDIKPDNILLNEAGHVHLTDFNTAAQYNPNRPLTSHSGTALYMAPEVFKGGGYGPQVDWWSLGVVFYECIYGRRPFEQHSSEELKQAVMHGDIEYGTRDNSITSVCISAIQGFLERDPLKRLGAAQLGEENIAFLKITQHPYFSPIDFARLEAKELPPLFRPSAESNYDSMYDLEELLLEENPLDSRVRYSSSKSKRNPKRTRPIGKKSAERVEREYKLMEREFLTFDCSMFERYEGFQDPQRLCVGEPPIWVKPAFEGAEVASARPSLTIVLEGGGSAAGSSVEDLGETLEGGGGEEDVGLHVQSAPPLNHLKPPSPNARYLGKKKHP
ncbi:uncharacterized protein VTP21DRAFT_4310 [Calcarisporiella thermophila]|uniref:uncharacterized protein n=1 Tax=Calcarisporiella thermophila TaxID=911321 RepID=UPI0037446BCB